MWAIFLAVLSVCLIALTIKKCVSKGDDDDKKNEKK